MSDDVKALVKDTYKELAAVYDNVRFVRICASRLIDLAQLQPGESVLDIATGTGHLALAAAQRVRPGGTVAGLDLSAEMVEQAQKKAVASGVDNAEWHQGDAERLPFPDETFDAVICASGIFFLPHQLAALREWHRVLKPGGRVLLSASPDCSIASVKRSERVTTAAGRRRRTSRGCAGTSSSTANGIPRRWAHPKSLAS